MAHGAWTKRTLARIVHQGRFSGNAVINVFHLETTPTGEGLATDDATAQTMLLDLLDDWTTNTTTSWVAMHVPAYSLLGIQGQILERPGQVSHALTAVDYTSGYPKPGTNPFPDVGATSLAAVVKWRSLVAGKSHRGRTYIGPVGENDVTSGVIAGNFPTRCNTWITALMGRYGPTGLNLNWRLTVYSRPYDQGDYGYVKGQGSARVMYFPPDYNGDSSNILAGSLDLTARSQRRREIGVGA